MGSVLKSRCPTNSWKCDQLKKYLGFKVNEKNIAHPLELLSSPRGPRDSWNFNQ
jgi:hypothetical protein